MAQITSAIAGKQLRKLNDQRDALLAMEKKSRAFTAAIQEDVESVRPAYDFQATQDALVEIEEKIRNLKHTLNCFNSTYVIPEFNMTIDQMLIYIPQLTSRKKRLDGMRSKLPKERVQSSYGRGNNIIEYDYANYDISKAEEAYTTVSDELAVGIGAVCGYLNSVFILKVGLPPFIATMAMMQALRGFAYLLTNGSSIMVTSQVFGVLGRRKTLGIPNTVYILIVFIIIFAFIAKYTVFGRRCYTIGGNGAAARLSGINVHRTVTILYVVNSAMCGLVGMLYTSQLGAAIPSSNADFAFDVISAVVLGGCAMTGGKGSMAGTIMGVLILAILDNGLIMLNVSSHWQLVCSGLVLLIAVSIDAMKQKRVDHK